MKDPHVRESCPEALASRKVVYREVCTEGSETANPGSNEQELNKRLFKTDEVAHHTNVQRIQQVLISRFSGYWGKECVLTWGGLGIDSFSMCQEVSRSHSSQLDMSRHHMDKGGVLTS